MDAIILQIVKNKKPHTVNQLIALVREQSQISENQALDQIIDLKNRGKIRLATEPLPPSLKLSSYLKNSQARWYWITTIFALITLLLVFLVPEKLEPWIYLRNFLGAIFVLYLPGYTFIKTMFPIRTPIKMSTHDLDKIERFALNVGMSLVLVPLVGLFLNYTPLGIRLVPVFFSLLTLSIIFASTALIREHRAKIKTQIL
jgi:uncharacterized membrane protein